ncbi:tRNA glutamyl-Q(34) synthetase GluQRS [Microlunatus elymi]|uniref:tRNA glutamyl-Q(34) synthetase GluQRS n=1 Tax=Microlunatus elymi TaxID=2596828 RepID=UPI001D195A8D|nr:tRNA glutamyl-Q(34) synthetase GluQRS [Microlunatus elymi]
MAGAAPTATIFAGVIRGRYAPSPTGELHLGNLRTAVLAWLFAHRDDSDGDRGELLYRIEDLDASRVRPGVAEAQRRDLESLGLDFDPPLVVQSERFAAYRAALKALADRSYPCFCTRREIAEAASAPHAVAGRYPGTCRGLTAAERAERARTRTPALRLRAAPDEVTISDLLHGDVSGRPDDIVLRRNDGVAAYNLAVVVDDADSEVNQVVRGDDLLESAISQAYLTQLLGRRVPIYAHVPLALNSDGRRLAKRDGAVTLSDLAAGGVGPDRVLTRIAASLGLAGPDEPVSLRLLLERFDAAALPRPPWIVDG